MFGRCGSSSLLLLLLTYRSLGLRRWMKIGESSSGKSCRLLHFLLFLCISRFLIVSNNDPHKSQGYLRCVFGVLLLISHCPDGTAFVLVGVEGRTGDVGCCDDVFDAFLGWEITICVETGATIDFRVTIAGKDSRAFI